MKSARRPANAFEVTSPEIINWMEEEYLNLTAVPTTSLLGTPIALVDYDKAVAAAKQLARLDGPAAVAAANTHIIAAARHDASFGGTMRRFNLVLPDGMPLVRVLNADGAGLRERVYGPYFMERMIKATPRPWRHFFFGGSTTCLNKLQTQVLQLQPDLEVAGTFSPPYRPWTEADERQFASIINEASPDFIWVALGGERQERWIIENRHRYRRGVFFAVGDAFELLSGSRPFAPAWMQRASLTWLYRLRQEPRRLFSRYLKYNSLFIYYLLLERVRRRQSVDYKGHYEK